MMPEVFTEILPRPTLVMLCAMLSSARCPVLPVCPHWVTESRRSSGAPGRQHPTTQPYALTLRPSGNRSFLKGINGRPTRRRELARGFPGTASHLSQLLHAR